MLKKALSYFSEQIYNEKELIILYLKDDINTSSFVKENAEYNYSIVTESDSIATSIFIRSKSNILKHYADFHDGDEIEIVVKSPNEEECLTGFFYNKSGEVKIKSSTDEFFEISTDGSWHWVKDEESNLSKMNPVVQFDNSIKLYAGEKKNGILHKGWITEQKRQTNSNIFFYEINPVTQISLGYRRNMAIHLAQGEYICVWDDDDWFAPERIFNQMNFIEFTKKPACALVNQVIFNHNTQNAYISCPRPEGWENSLICKKSDMGQYEDLPKKEDTPLLLRIWKANNIAVIDDPYLYIYNLHKTNVSGNSHFHQILSFSRKINGAHYEVVKDRILSYSS